MKIYPLGDILTVKEAESLKISTEFNSRYGHKNIGAIKSGEYRSPKKGEWYISGAIPSAYRAPNDLSSKYIIGKLVKFKTTILTEVVRIG